MRQIWLRMGGGSDGIVQAHNGYIDLYLNLGIVGVSLLVITILTGLAKAQKLLEQEFAHAVLKIALIMIAVIVNYTEATFKPLTNVFVLMLFGVLELPRSKRSERKVPSESRLPTFADASTNAGDRRART